MLIDKYKKAFTDNALPGFLWDDGTFYLYAIVIIIVCLCGWIATSRSSLNKPVKRGRTPYIISAFILTALLGLRGLTVGIDTPTYRGHYTYAHTTGYFSDTTLEPGYQFIAKLLRYILPNAETYVFLYSAMTVILVFLTIWKYRRIINPYIAFSFYVGMFFFQAMNLLRLYFAASFILWNFRYLIEERYKRFSIVILLSSLIHYSSLVMFFPLLFLLVYKKSKTFAFAGLVVVTAVSISLSLHFEQYMMIARYATYGESNDSDRAIGIMLFVEYMPFLLGVFYIFHYKIKGHWADLFTSFTAVAFFFRILSYYMPGGRLKVHFLGLFVLLLPYLVEHIRLNHRSLYKPTLLMLTVYLIFRIHIYFMGYFSTDGIMPYYFLWNE